MSEGQDSESPGFKVTVPLSGAAIDTLWCLFLHGPTWDGNVPSKQGRNELVDLKLAARCSGYQFLTREGVRLALENKLDRKKETTERRRRERVALLERVEEIFIPPKDGERVMGLAENQQARRPTVEDLQQILSRPEPEDGRV